MCVDIYRYPPFRPENCGHCGACRIRNIITAAKYDHTLTVFEQLFYDGEMRVVRFFKRCADHDVANVKDPFFNVERRQSIELFSDLIRGLSGTVAAAAPADAFILGTAKYDDLGVAILLRFSCDYLAQTRIVSIAAVAKKRRIGPLR
jgi:hypothetical protein